MTDFRKEYEHKTVTCGFYGASAALATSQELFSSFEVDPGSSLLLHSVGSCLDVDSLGTVLDVGCGVGTLALALTAKNPRIRATCVDRDALALAFTERNAQANGITNIACVPSLGVSAVAKERFDLVMSNIPAKAGNPVIEEMLSGFSSVAADGGTVAVVIVRTLSDFVREALAKGGAEILHENVTREYTVYHYRGMRAALADRGLEAYVRGSFPFSRAGKSWSIRAVYGIPEFDSLDHATDLALDLLEGLDLRVLARVTPGATEDAGGRRALVVNPGQGHVPVFLSLAARDAGVPENALTIASAGRDYLALRASETAVREATGHSLIIHHVPWLGRVEGSFHLVVVNYSKEAIGRAHELLAQDLAGLVAPGGTLIVTGSSTLMARLDSIATESFSRVKDVKRKGNRAMRYTRKTR